MKELTHTEKQHLEVKIEVERQRQRALRMNPNTPVTSPMEVIVHEAIKPR